VVGRAWDEDVEVAEGRSGASSGCRGREERGGGGEEATRQYSARQRRRQHRGACAAVWLLLSFSSTPSARPPPSQSEPPPQSDHAASPRSSCRALSRSHPPTESRRRNRRTRLHRAEAEHHVCDGRVHVGRAWRVVCGGERARRAADSPLALRHAHPHRCEAMLQLQLRFRVPLELFPPGPAVARAVLAVLSLLARLAPRLLSITLLRPRWTVGVFSALSSSRRSSATRRARRSPSPTDRVRRFVPSALLPLVLRRRHSPAPALAVLALDLDLEHDTPTMDLAAATASAAAAAPPRPLPDELILMVVDQCDHLRPDSARTRALAALCRLARRYHAHAQRVLYSRIELVDENVVWLEPGSLVDALVRKASLRRLVRSVGVSYYSTTVLEVPRVRAALGDLPNVVELRCLGRRRPVGRRRPRAGRHQAPELDN